MIAESKNHYQVLQVDPAAEPEIIAAAYKKLALKYHPDHNPSPEANRAMQRINLAYQILNDPVERARYDQELQNRQARPQPPSGHEPVDVQPTQGYSIPRYQPRYPFHQASRGSADQEEQDEDWFRRERGKTGQRRDSSARRLKREIPNPRLGLSWIIIYIVIALVLFLVFRTEASRTEGVVVILLIALIASIPIVLKLDDLMRK